MALPDRSPIPLATASGSIKTGFGIRVPPEVFGLLGSGPLDVSHQDGLNLLLPDRTLPLDANPQVRTELYEVGDTLVPIAEVNTRLSIPFNTASSSKATAESTPTKNGIADKRPIAKVKQQADTPLARSVSSPGAQSSTATPIAASTTPVIPLKTRVVQYLALGPASVAEIEAKMGGVEQDIMRVVRVVGRQVAENPPKYSLQPKQYSKIKIVEWQYTAKELSQVHKLALAAFEELELPADAEERGEMERKIIEARAGPTPSVSPPTPATKPLPNTAVFAPAPAPQPAASARSSISTVASNSSTQSTNAAAAASASAKPRTSSSGKSKGPVAREMARFRAEQARATSAPGLIGTNGNASPRAAAGKLEAGAEAPSKKKRPTAEKAERSEERPIKEEKPKVRRSSEEDRSKADKKRKRERHPSPDFTSSDEEEEEEETTRGRTKQRTEKVKPKTSRIAPASTAPSISPPGRMLPTFNKRKSPVGHSISPPERVLPTFTKRKSPPEPLDLNHRPSATPSTTASERPDDPEDLRDRYEELYPAYQLLTQKLAGLHEVAEGVEGGDEAEGELLPSKEELNKMVRKWRKWHEELEGIRKWFGRA